MVQGEATRIENFKELLDEFKELPDRVECPPTFMEIAGYPHYENVCSNILAFFMDPEEGHSLGNLMLDALVSTAKIDASEGNISSSVSVDREVITDAGNRIDLLITSDDHAILIENKIYANVSNPFDDYSAYIDRIADGRVKHKLLLTVFPTDEGSRWGFANLTYDEFIYQIRAILGHYVSSADTRYLTIFLDFLGTLEHLQRGSRMNSQFVELLAQRQEEAEELFYELTRFKGELRKKVSALRERIDVTKYQNVDQSLYRERTSLYDDLVTNISVSNNLVVCVEASIFPNGWEVWIWPSEGTYSELKDLLNKFEIPFEENEADGGVYHHDNFKYKYDENLDGVSSLLQALISKLATYQEE